MAAGAAAPLAGGLWALGAKALAADAPPQPPSIEEFVRPPITRGAALSPDGQQIAVLHEQQTDAGKRIAYVTLTDAANPSAKPSQIMVGRYAVEGLRWANNDRLLITVRVDGAASSAHGGTYVHRQFDLTVRRLVSVDRSGNAVLLLNDAPEYADSNTNLSEVVDYLPDDPEHIVMMFWDPRIQLPALHMVNVTSGESKLLEAGVDNTYGFATLKGAPVLRWDFLTIKTAGIYARPIGEKTWKLVRKVRYDDIIRPDFELLGPAGDDPNIWLARTCGPDDAGMSLHLFDLKTLTLGAVVASRDGADIDGALFDEHQRYFAAIVSADRTEYDFVDKSLAGHFKAMNKFFENQCNVDIVDWNQTKTRLLVNVSGPQEAGVYYFYDREARRFDPLDEERPWLRDRLAPIELLDVKTRDGVAMRAYLTVPIAAAGAGPRPLVVMPHGGPEQRDRCDYDIVAQAFAARGWMVLQPNFRGSSGYGASFALAGHRHWGDRMQDDVDDAVAHVLATGRADPGRVAIWGGSYGGYAALIGAVRKPKLYRCAVSLAGVSDLLEMLAWEKRVDPDDSPFYKAWVEMIGDPATDHDALVAASPARNADVIAAPILLMHGNKDETVDPAQSRLMADALKRAGKACDHVVLDGEGHHMSGWNDKTTTLVLTRSCEFIAKAFA